jgi:hypothetical protein
MSHFKNMFRRVEKSIKLLSSFRDRIILLSKWSQHNETEFQINTIF